MKAIGLADWIPSLLHGMHKQIDPSYRPDMPILDILGLP
jgi:hypothetical protein